MIFPTTFRALTTERVSEPYEIVRKLLSCRLRDLLYNVDIREKGMKMITINNRNELDNFLYGANSTSPDTLVGVARIGGELLSEALTNELSDSTFHIGEFFPMGDEGEGITVDRDGNVLEDFLYY